ARRGEPRARSRVGDRDRIAMATFVLAFDRRPDARPAFVARRMAVPRGGLPAHEPRRLSRQLHSHGLVRPVAVHSARLPRLPAGLAEQTAAPDAIPGGVARTLHRGARADLGQAAALHGAIRIAGAGLGSGTSN